MDDRITSFLKQNERLVFYVFIIIILISLFYGIGMVYELTGELIAWFPIWIFGDSVQGTVTRQSTIESDGTFYQLEFEYQVPTKNGETLDLSGKLIVSQSFWRSHEPGSSLIISYLSWFPKIARIKDHPYELNMWMMTSCLYIDFVLQLILIPIGAQGMSRLKLDKGLILCLRVGGITLFIVTVVALMLEFLLDSLGMKLGIFSGGAIPLMLGIVVGLLTALSIRRAQVKRLKETPEFSWKD